MQLIALALASYRYHHGDFEPLLVRRFGSPSLQPRNRPAPRVTPIQIHPRYVANGFGRYPPPASTRRHHRRVVRGATGGGCRSQLRTHPRQWSGVDGMSFKRSYHYSSCLDVHYIGLRFTEQSPTGPECPLHRSSPIQGTFSNVSRMPTASVPRCCT